MQCTKSSLWLPLLLGQKQMPAPTSTAVVQQQQQQQQQACCYKFEATVEDFVVQLSWILGLSSRRLGKFDRHFWLTILAQSWVHQNSMVSTESSQLVKQ